MSKNTTAAQTPKWFKIQILLGYIVVIGSLGLIGYIAISELPSISLDTIFNGTLSLLGVPDYGPRRVVANIAVITLLTGICWIVIHKTLAWWNHG